MPLAAASSRQTIAACAWRGLLASIAYATAECFFLSIVPWLPGTPFVTALPDWRQTLLSFGIYALAGTLAGALAGLLLRFAARRIAAVGKASLEDVAKAIAAGAIIWALAINLAAFSFYRPSVWIRFAVSAAWTAALAWSIGEGRWARKLRLLRNPWTISLLLLGLPWLAGNLPMHGSSLMRLAVTLAYFILALAGPWLAEGLIAGRGPQAEAAFAAVAALVIFASSVYANDRLGLPFAPASARGAGPPNVVLVVMDTVRADHLSVYGYDRETTPNLKKFAGHATLFSMAISPSDITLSSHASLFTGLYPRSHGARLAAPGEKMPAAGSALAPRFRTLAGILSEHGYRTIGVAANKYYLVPDFGLNQGFSYYSVPVTATLIPDSPFFYLREGIAHAEKAVDDWRSDPQLFYLCRRAADINAEVIPLLGQARHEHRPFFLFVNYMDAHEPVHPPPPYDAMFPGRIEGQNIGHTIHKFYKLQSHINGLVRKLREDERADFVSQYDGGIAYIDSQFQNLLAHLERLGLAENTLIIVTGDHGQAYGEKNLLGHGGIAVYQELVHVPLIIRFPHHQEKAVVDDTVSLVDVLPTVLDTLGLEPAQGLQGRSLLRPAPTANPFVISESYPGYKWEHVLKKRFNRVERAVFEGRRKFVGSTADKRELYDLAADPNEQTNLYRAGDAASRQMEETLAQWLEVSRNAGPAPTKLDRQTLERLKSLGYLQ